MCVSICGLLPPQWPLSQMKKTEIVSLWNYSICQLKLNREFSGDIIYQVDRIGIELYRIPVYRPKNTEIPVFFTTNKRPVNVDWNHALSVLFRSPAVWMLSGNCTLNNGGRWGSKLLPNKAKKLLLTQQIRSRECKINLSSYKIHKTKIFRDEETTAACESEVENWVCDARRQAWQTSEA